MTESRDLWFCQNNRVKLEKLLGVSIINNLIPTEKHLLMKYPPADKQSMFKKVDGFYRAKDFIKLNKDYISLCRELGLKQYSAIEFSIGSGLIAYGGGNVMHYYGVEQCFIVTPNNRDISKEFSWLKFVEACDLVDARELYNKKEEVG
jgi:hypothetical protein